MNWNGNLSQLTFSITGYEKYVKPFTQTYYPQPNLSAQKAAVTNLCVVYEGPIVTVSPSEP